MFFAPDFNQWLATDLQPVPRLSGRKITPYEQAEQILYDYVIGRPMAYSVDYRKLEPLTQHVWEFKTPDVRLIGWVPKKANIILVRGELKNNLKKFKDYAPYVADVVVFRDALDLDPPKYITGVRANDIL